MQRYFWLGLAVTVCCGCQSERFPVAPASGTVTLNGKPLPNAHVLVQPVSQGTTFEIGPESVGLTDAEGRFTLSTIEPERKGAMIGKHRVSVTIPEEESRYGGGAESGRPAGKPVYTIPRRYRLGEALQIEVPPEGTDNLELKLTSP